MTTEELVQTALKIILDSEEAADMDAVFDGDEFSGPARYRRLEAEIDKLCEQEKVSRAFLDDAIRKAYERMNNNSPHRGD